MLRYLLLMPALAAISLWIGYALGQRQGHTKPYYPLRVAVVLGGNPDHPFSQEVYSGARAAAEELGCRVVPYWTEWQSPNLLREFKAALEDAPDGIALMPFPGRERLEPLIREADEKGIPLSMLTVEPASFDDGYSPNADGYVGQTTFAAGYRLAQRAVERWAIPPGQRCLLLDTPNVVGRSARAEGEYAALRAAGLQVEEIDLHQVWRGEYPGGLTVVLQEKLQSKTSYSLVVADALTLHELLNLIRRADIDPSNLRFACFDTDRASLEEIKGGVPAVVADQQPFVQGYLAVLQICLRKKYGVRPFRVDTGMAFVDETNVDTWIEWRTKHPLNRPSQS